MATTASPLPQLLEGGGYFVAPGDTAGLLSAMRTLLDPRERERLGAVALERAARLSWRASARATLAALDDVLTIGRRAVPMPAVS